MPHNVISLALSALSGLLFGIGLIVARMHDPGKVLGFLDLAGAWDPSLAFVMVGAIGVSVLPIQWLIRRQHDLFGQTLSFPTNSRGIDLPLITGSLLFGVGWGISGICPGPAIVDMSLLWWPALQFGAGMAIGFGLWARFKST